MNKSELIISSWFKLNLPWPVTRLFLEHNDSEQSGLMVGTISVFGTVTRSVWLAARELN